MELCIIHQEILNNLSKDQSVSFLELAKQLKTRRTNLKPFIDELVQENLISTFKPNGRTYLKRSLSSGIKVSPLIKGLNPDQENSLITHAGAPAPASNIVPSKKELSHSCLSKTDNYKPYRQNTTSTVQTGVAKKTHFSKLLRDRAADAISLYGQQDFFPSHQVGSKTYAAAHADLTALFDGTFYNSYHTVYAKKHWNVKFTLDDFERAIANTNKAISNIELNPVNKDSLRKACKYLPLSRFLYNVWTNFEPLFLRYQKEPEPLRANLTKEKYPEAAKMWHVFFSQTKLSYQDENTLIKFTNELIDTARETLKKNLPHLFIPLKIQDLIYVAQQTISETCDDLSQFKFHWLRTPWFREKLTDNILEELG